MYQRGFLECQYESRIESSADFDGPGVVERDRSEVNQVNPRELNLDHLQLTIQLDHSLKDLQLLRNIF